MIATEISLFARAKATAHPAMPAPMTKISFVFTQGSPAFSLNLLQEVNSTPWVILFKISNKFDKYS
jgi:hypothetical protein